MDLKKILRVKEYWKNFLVFLPAILEKKFNILLIPAFISLCISSSMGYIINDLEDRDKDYTKIFGLAEIIFIFLFLVNVVVLLFIKNVIIILVIYGIFLNYLIYSKLLSKIYGVDIIALGIGYLLKTLTGYIIINSNPDQNLLLFSLFFGSYLNLEKRYAKFRLKKTYYTEEKYEKILSMVTPSVLGLVISYFSSTILDYKKEYLIIIPLFIFLMFRVALAVRENPELGLSGYKLMFGIKSNLILTLLIIILLIIL